MTQTAKSTFSVIKWAEHPLFEQADGQKMTYSYVEYKYVGDLDATCRLTYAMHYLSPDHAIFTGVEHFTGTLHGKQGSFVLVHSGCYKKDEGAFADVAVSPGTATGQLAGLKATARMVLEGHAEHYPLSLQYQLP